MCAGGCACARRWMPRAPGIGGWRRAWPRVPVCTGQVCSAGSALAPNVLRQGQEILDWRGNRAHGGRISDRLRRGNVPGALRGSAWWGLGCGCTGGKGRGLKAEATAGGNGLQGLSPRGGQAGGCRGGLVLATFWQDHPRARWNVGRGVDPGEAGVQRRLLQCGREETARACGP